MKKLRVVSPDADPESADWTKQSWDLPPYKSREFLADWPDLDHFRMLPVYKHAVAKGLIVDDEWVGIAPDADITAIDSLHSSRREKLVEHIFVGEVLRSLWCAGVHEVDVLRAETDAAGYDIVVEVGSIVRHIQLKSSAHSAKTSRQKVNSALSKKPSGCVLWVTFDPSNLELGPFLWFGGRPGEPLPNITGFAVAKHSKGNAKGEKAERKNIRVINKGEFTNLATISDVIEMLFGHDIVSRAD